MLETFQKTFSELDSSPARKKFLLAVSGGLDSVVMVELFRLSGYKYSIAHCNFQLRGEESEEDEGFVKRLASKHKVSFFSTQFETEKFCTANKVSVQMGARQLRYEWLEKIRQKNKLDYIVTAHHADDSIETFFINLIRGTGISGLQGIKARNENVMRPMLQFYRKNIEYFAKKNKLKWREDSSNTTDKYERNKIRHHLLPALAKVDAGAKKQIMRTMELLSATDDIYRESIKTIASRFVKVNQSKTEIDLDLFSGQTQAELCLYELIKEYGFNYEQAVMVGGCVKRKEHSGRTFFSDSHRILTDRNKLYILSLKSGGGKHFVISKTISLINLGAFFCLFEKIKRNKKFKIETVPQIASFDFDKLVFPLEVRKWEKGDRFYPLGMNKPKKVSDYLIDCKVSIIDKEQVYVLLSKGEIVWLMGYRIDERFKITEATKNVYLCNLKIASL